MQIPILNGIYASPAGEWRTSYPRNLVPVPKVTGISQGYLRPAEGITLLGAGPGNDRGGYRWRDACYRVMGTKLVRISAGGAVATLGDVGAGGYCTFDSSFDVLAVWSGGALYYWDGSTLTRVSDPDLGAVLHGCWIAGYFLSTDGTSIIATDLNDRTSVNPLRYGSAESDPDGILAVDELKNEAYAFGRYTVEVFENIGGTGFPFRRIEGAQVARGVVGTHAYAPFVESFAFVGSARNEPPSVWLMGAGNTTRLATREIDQLLAEYTEAQLAETVVESRAANGHQHLMIHLPDQCLVYDAAASQAVGEAVWFSLTTSITGRGQYRARGHVWCYDRWIVGDPAAARVGLLADSISTHWGETTGWEFGVAVLYNEGRGAIVHELELVGLPGRGDIAAESVIWTSHSSDGETFGPEVPTLAGGQGQRDKRVRWRRLGKMAHTRIQRFRGTSDCQMSMARLEAQLEGLDA